VGVQEGLDWIGWEGLCPGAKRNLSDKLHAPSCRVAAAAAETLRLLLLRDLLLHFRLLFALSSRAASCFTFGLRPSNRLTEGLGQGTSFTQLVR